MLPTPDTSHVSFDNVYEPAEDSFLLLDALSSELESAWLSERFKQSKSPQCPLVLEVGTGSGVVLAFVAGNAKQILGRTDVLTFGTDLNLFACNATQETVRRAMQTSPAPSEGYYLGPLNASLTSPLRPHSVDVLIFNPPYVPSETVPAPPPRSHDAETALSRHDVFARDSKLLALATDGGAGGMEITNLVLWDLPDVLHLTRGVAYVLLCAQNRPEAVKAEIRAWEGGGIWEAETVRTSGKQGGWEKLQIVRIARKMEVEISSG